MNLNQIIQAIAFNRVRITGHARKEAEDDNLLLQEIYFSVNCGEIIEDYPDDRPFPSCLIYGTGLDNHPIHSVWAYNNQQQLAILITVYRPNPNHWINWRQRRKP
jgi:hypothetical protein